MVFNFKDAKISEDGSISDGTNTYKPEDKGYHLIKAKFDAGGKFARNKKTKADHKAELDKGNIMSFKKLKALFGSKGYSIDRSGLVAIEKSLRDGTFSMEKVMDTLKKWKKVTVSSTIVDISNGVETEFTKSALEKEAKREARLAEIAERKAKKQADKEARARATELARETRIRNKIADEESKLAVMIAERKAKLEAKKKQLLN